MSTTSVFSLRLPNERAESLKRLARRNDRSAAEIAARLVDEGLRRSEFALIDFRDTAGGREAYVQGTRIPVWWVVTLVRGLNSDLAKAARHLSWPEAKVKAALNYAEAFAQEIEDAIADARDWDYEKMKRLLPSLELFECPARSKKIKVEVPVA